MKLVDSQIEPIPLHPQARGVAEVPEPKTELELKPDP